MSEYKYLLEELEKIKNGGDSFLGCDGGNINAEIWFCGVEFGGTPKEMNTYYENHVKHYVKDKLEIPFRENYEGKYLKSKFDRYLTAMYLILLENYSFDKTVDSIVIDDFLKNKLYNKNSKSFKLNLFPIAKKDVSWDKEIEEKLNINRDVYYSSMFKGRSKFFQDIISKYQPKTIICFSPTNHSDYFIKAFLKDRKLLEFKFDYFTDRNNKEHLIKIIRHKKTQYIIMPFLGMGNITNHEDVINISEFIKENYINS
tara:strand:- start:109 stop:879 length:771 start_codon:yes stop_codon:yes gene_type:complete